MSKNSDSKVSIAVKGLIALAFLSTAVYWMTGLSSPKNNYVNISTLLQEAEKIIPPNEAFLIKKSNNHKTSSALVFMQYRTPLNKGQIFEHYKSNLEHAGWHHKNSNNNFIDEYCKNKLSAEIEFNPQMQIYNFSITWHQRTTSQCNS
jgi:hypothetical protein